MKIGDKVRARYEIVEYVHADPDPRTLTRAGETGRVVYVDRHVHETEQGTTETRVTYGVRWTRTRAVHEVGPGEIELVSRRRVARRRRAR